MNTPNAEILSDELFPKNKLPEIATSPLKYAFDADKFPVKLILPTEEVFNASNVIGFPSPIATCKEFFPLCKYNSPSTIEDDISVVPLLI